MSDIVLSICLPTYNRPKRIRQILNQILSFKSNEIEIIISDDNPPSNSTKEVINPIKDSRLKYFKNMKNLGFDTNILMTIKRAKGDFIFLLMDEDEIEIESIPWILKTIKENKNITQICGSIGDKRFGYNELYFKYHYGNITIKKGTESLRKLLFYYTHGSGIILRRKSLNLNKAIKYVGSQYIQLFLIAQSLIAGDTICISRIVANIGKIQYESDQILIKGQKYNQSLGRLNQFNYKIDLIYEITKEIKNGKVLRNELLAKNEKYIIYYFFEIFISFNRLETIKALLNGFFTILNMKNSKRFRFWAIFLMKSFYYIKRLQFFKEKYT